MKRYFKVILLGLLVPTICSAQAVSQKRGMSWVEDAVAMTDAQLELFTPGVSWAYNWGNKPKRETTTISAEGPMSYAPMCWNSNYNETAMRTWLSNHPETRWLLGFNEPNFSSQANMTPQQAATAWPKVAKLAADFGLRLVSPALNFSGEKVGGRTWSPYEWLDEFLRLCPDANFDCIALHCYMNWSSAMTWFATEYFYKDLYNPSKNDVYGRYPNLVGYLDAYKAQHGHFPKMMLTEFCAYEYDGAVNADFQIDQMTQKVQNLEKSDLVEGYAWFIANANASSFPYNSLLTSNNTSAGLSTLGKVYVHMSSFDTSRYYGADELVLAKDYVDASINDQQVKLRPNTDVASSSPLQVQLIPSAWATYQFAVPASATYQLSVRVKTTAENPFYVYVDKKRVSNIPLASTSSAWDEQTVNLKLTEGNHSIMLYNPSTTTTIMLSELMLVSDKSGVESIKADEVSGISYNIDGTIHTDNQKGIVIVNGKKVLK